MAESMEKWRGSLHSNLYTSPAIHHVSLHPLHRWPIDLGHQSPDLRPLPAARLSAEDQSNSIHPFNASAASLMHSETMEHPRQLTRRTFLTTAAVAVIAAPTAALARRRSIGYGGPTFTRAPRGPNVYGHGNRGYGLPALVAVAFVGVVVLAASLVVGSWRERRRAPPQPKRWNRSRRFAGK